MSKLLKTLSILLFSLMVGIVGAEPKPDTAVMTTKAAPVVQNAPVVVFKTSLGELQIELFEDKAPVSVRNFLQYVDSGFYDGVIFHRVIPGFVVQGGGFDQRYESKATRAPIINESDNGEKNLRGTLSMARTSDPNSATSQFFINLQDNAQLDSAPGQPGYAVFGRVVAGMKTVESMAQQTQGKHRGMFENAPNEPIVIERAFRKTSTASDKPPSTTPTMPKSKN